MGAFEKKLDAGGAGDGLAVEITDPAAKVERRAFALRSLLAIAFRNAARVQPPTAW
ncbi:MAG TPA: hypothetical protein VHW03_05055 [Chthoniobacterales bacterium]|nr:hypothetical protein [Chthoniobacterales bacterium]